MKVPLKHTSFVKLPHQNFKTYSAWRKKVLSIFPNAYIEGDKDIACAPGIGEWNGETGQIYFRALQNRVWAIATNISFRK